MTSCILLLKLGRTAANDKVHGELIQGIGSEVCRCCLSGSSSGICSGGPPPTSSVALLFAESLAIVRISFLSDQ